MTVADMIRCRVQRSKHGGTFRGVLVVTIPDPNPQCSTPLRTYTRRVGKARLREDEAFADAYRERHHYIELDRLPE